MINPFKYIQNLMRYHPIMVLSLISLSSLLFFYANPQATTTLSSKKPLADAFMEDIITTIYDQNGQPKLTISTPKMTHYSQNDTTLIEAPRLMLFRKSPTPWIITAMHAKAEKGIENINLWQDVLIYHPKNNYSPPTTVKTYTLTVHPSQQTADTKDKITLIQPDLIVNAIGMHANMRTGDIQLLSNSRGEYVPHT